MWLAAAGSGPARAALELHDVVRHELDNGLTVLLLVDRNFAVASVQMLYRVGARNEVTGKTGLAHFLEHLAFRATENFPDTEVVSRIYAVGGEWHGYTWTDQTTYYSTVPREQLDLLLQIEADRMARLELDPTYMEAERGAVLSEMHLYENQPSSLLIDALMFTSFQAHPYRNNTIGWESDIEDLAHEDVVAFYREHYHPANAVLAVVGDFDPDAVTARIDALFGDLPARAPTPLPHTEEPLQEGERRVSVTGTTPGKRFMMAWRAPGASHPDYAAFLVLQELLAGGSGVSFLQNDWGTPAREGSVLHGAGDAITSWYPPSAQAYAFVVGGAARDGNERKVEAEIDARLERFQAQAPTPAAIDAAVASIVDELAFDVQTTEDAAHQLAFFEGLGALDVLLTLPARLRAVSPDDVLAAVRRYLRPERRTIAWYRPGASRPPEPTTPEGRTFPRPGRGKVDTTPAAPAVSAELRGGVPLLLRRSDLSPTVVLDILVPGEALSGAGFAPREPGVLAYTDRGHARDFAAMLRRASSTLASARALELPAATPSLDPATRLEQEFTDIMAPRSLPAVVQPVSIAVAGDIDADAAHAQLEAAFGDVDAAARSLDRRREVPTGRRGLRLDVPVAQSRLGYIAASPAPGDENWLATRMLLYVFAHDYEGRFGKEAISRRGLAYYVDARYRSGGGPGWITLAVGVDTPKLPALEALLRAELKRLADEPPTGAEIDEARQHLAGRAISAAQSNDELAMELSRHWLWHGELPDADRLAAELDAVTRADVLSAIPAFVDGMTITVSP